MNYHVTNIGNGSLHVMAAPKARQLHNHIRFLKMNGITKVLCLMEPDEMERVNIGAEEQTCLHEGIKYENFPIVDHSVTERDRLQAMLKRVLEEIRAGENLVVHCFAGIGRTGIVSCGLLIEDGMTAEEAIDLVSEKRHLKVPETSEQTQFVKDYADALIA